MKSLWQYSHMVLYVFHHFQDFFCTPLSTQNYCFPGNQPPSAISLMVVYLSRLLFHPPRKASEISVSVICSFSGPKICVSVYIILQFLTRGANDAFELLLHALQKERYYDHNYGIS